MTLTVRPALFFAIPLLLSVVGAVITFDLPPLYFEGLGWLVVIALLALCADRLLQVSLPGRVELREALSFTGPEKIVGMSLGLLVLAACVVDLVMFPLPLLQPSIYADFGGGRSYVRHISNMCWILPVIGVLCTSRMSLRTMFIVCGIIFPVLVLDRNRLFASAYTAIAVMVVFVRAQLPWRRVALVTAGLLALFSQLGRLRSGNLDWISLPFSEFYTSLGPGMKWILLYVSSGAYNFSSIMAKGYGNDSFLINQLIPGSGSVETLDSGIPLDDPVINVGTEYFPFLMAYGPIGAATAALGLYLGLVASVVLLRRRTSLFTFLIFLRISYVCLMAGFAPQAYVWTNFGFVGLCILLMLATPVVQSLRQMSFRA